MWPRARWKLLASLHDTSQIATRSALKHVAKRRHHRRASTKAQPATPEQVIFSGIQPTGVPHLGNYLGALRAWVSIQNEATTPTKLLYSVVDLHSLTSNYEPTLLRLYKRQSFATLLAVGLDPARSIIFYQSDVPAHAEMNWILTCNAGMGSLSRMTQWKSKIGDGATIEAMLKPTANPKSQERMKLGLFAYPVLQAADILVHQATHIPVGEDQLQHVEFASECAGQFNHRFGTEGFSLVQPKPIVSEAKRLMSLKHADKKMSKSQGTEESRILLTDQPETIQQKLRGAITDSWDGFTYDRDKRPGVSNLMELMTYVHPDRPSLEELGQEVRTMKKELFKERLAQLTTEYLRPIRERFEMLMGEREGRELDAAAESGAEKASASAKVTLDSVKRAIGLR